MPGVREGAARSGRDLDGFEIAMKPLVATAPNDEILAERVRDARARLAFYCSNPAYRKAFDIHGLTDLAEEMAVLSKAGRWEEMPAKINDDVLETYVTIGTYDEIGDRLVERYENVVTSVEFSIAVGADDDRDRLAELVARLHAAS